MNRAAFTFIELAIVLTIIGILSLPTSRLFSLIHTSRSTEQGIVRASDSHRLFFNQFSEDVRLASEIAAPEETASPSIEVRSGDEEWVRYEATERGLRRVPRNPGEPTRTYENLDARFEIDRSGQRTAVRVAIRLSFQTYRSEFDQERTSVFLTTIGERR